MCLVEWALLAALEKEYQVEEILQPGSAFCRDSCIVDGSL